MDVSELSETVLNKDTRLLKRITIPEAEEIISVSNAFQDLMGDDVTPRKTFIQDNAQYATIDI